MKKFIVLYSGGLEMAGTSPQQREASMKAWEKWFKGLGKSIVEMGGPFARSRTLSSSGSQDGNGGIATNAYSIFQANDLDAAAKLAKDCPVISEGGKAHIFEIVAM
jgi:hypothetical protein